MKNEYISRAGYYGAVTILALTSLLLYFKNNSYLETVELMHLVLLFCVTFLVMFTYELLSQYTYNKKNAVNQSLVPLHKQNRYILKSSLYRFFTLLIPLLTVYTIQLLDAYLILGESTSNTVQFYQYLIYIYCLFGLPYMFLTLKYRGEMKYEFNDYAILTMVGFRSLYHRFMKRKARLELYKNRRVKKMTLVYVVNYFFLTLMTVFIMNEFNHVDKSMTTIMTEGFHASYWFIQFKTFFLLILHGLFMVDVGIGIIGYSFASRWIGNRTKSVDMTLFGWGVALICYPPFNFYVSEHLLGYHHFQTHSLIYSEVAVAITHVLLILFYTIFVWSSVALGFKFSNLTNRGIISHGPYKYVRHPAYTSKNMAWVIENSFVFTNIWATLAFFSWTTIYALRAITEERHLQKDSKYREYQKKVRYRFLPKIY